MSSTQSAVWKKGITVFHKTNNDNMKLFIALAFVCGLAFAEEQGWYNILFVFALSLSSFLLQKRLYKMSNNILTIVVFQL